MTLLVIAVGGAFGAVSRYLASSWVQDALGGAFPWGTMAVNVIGAAVLGFSVVWLQSTVSEELRQLVAVGFLGSFTTFSTFSFETLSLMREGAWLRAGSYALGSVLLALLAVALGVAVASAIWSQHP